MSPKYFGTARIVVPASLTAFFLLLSRSFLGLSLGDDSIYMSDGAHMGLSGLFVYHEWAPLYSLWFRALGFFCHDPVARYFLSWALIVILVTLVPTLFRTPAAWLYALIVLALPVVTDGPFVGLFASAMVVAGVCWVLPKRWSFAETLAAACILSFIVSFARPEYGYGVLLCAAATLAAVVLERLKAPAPATVQAVPISRAPAWLLLSPVIAASTVILFLLQRFPSHRSGMAFAQHFNIRAAVHGFIPAGPDCWRSDYAELRFGFATAHHALGGTPTLGQFFRANPRLFFGQIVDNLNDPHALFLLVFVVLVVLIPWLRKSTAALRPASLFVLLLSLPPLAGSIVIFPHTHYAAILIPSLTLFALQFLNLERWLRWALPAVLVLGFALLGFLYIVLPRMEKTFMSFDRLNLYRTQCIRQWDSTTSNADTSVFSVPEMPPIYVEPSHKLVFPAAFSTMTQFQSWVTQTQPAWITVDTDFSSQYGYRTVAAQYGVTQQQLADFLQNGLGYTPHACSADAQLTIYTRDKR